MDEPDQLIKCREPLSNAEGGVKKVPGPLKNMSSFGCF